MHLKIDKIVSSFESYDIRTIIYYSNWNTSGVAMFMKEPKFLNDNDIVSIEIEGLGSIRNRVRFI